MRMPETLDTSKYHLISLFEHSIQLAQANSIEEIAENTLNILSDVLNANIGSFHILRDDTLYPLYTKSEKLRNLVPVTLFEPSIVGRAAREKQTQYVKDTRDDADYLTRPGALEIELLSELAVPVVYNEKVLAVINLESDEIDSYSLSEIQLVETFAQYVAIAIEVLREKEELVEQEELLRGFMDSASDNFYLYDKDLRLVTINDAGMFLFPGHEKTDVIGKHMGELVPGLEKTGRIRDYQAVVETGNSVFFDDVWHPSAEGLRLSIKAFRVGDGLGIISNDITERRQIENALRESEALFRGFMQSATEAFLLLDKNMHYLDANNSWLTQSGLIRENVIGKHILEVDPTLKETGRYDAYLQVLETGEPVEFRSVESTYNVGTILDLTAFKTGTGLGIIVADVTDRIRYQRRLETLHDHADLLAKATTMEMVAEVTRESLTSILGFNRGSLGVVEGDVLNHKYRWGIDSTEEFRMPLDGAGLTVKVVNSGESIRTGDVSETRLYVDGVGDPFTFSELVVPVTVSDRVVGVINIESDARDAFSEDDQKLVETLASHIASAFSRLDYFDQLLVTLSDLEASKERWEELILSIPDPVLINNSTHYLYANQQAADLWGYDSPEDIVGQSVTLFFPEENGETLLQRARARLEGADILTRYEQNILKKNGVLVFADVNIKVITFNGEPAILSIHRDISERKLFEERLEMLHSHAASLSQARDLTHVVDITGEALLKVLGYTWCSIGFVEGDNLVFNRFWGYSSNVTLSLPLDGPGVTVQAVITKESILLHNIQESDVHIDPLGNSDDDPPALSELDVPIIVGGKAIAVINVESDREQAFSQVDLHLVEILAEHVAGAISRIRAAEDRMELERQVLVEQVRTEQAEELVQMKTRFMSTATHELRTPLAIIKGYIDLALEEESLPIIRDFLMVADRNADRLTSVTNDLLDQQSMEEYQLVLNKEPVNLNQIVSSVVGEMTGVVEERGQQIHVMPSDGSVTVLGDQVRLTQVVSNLLSNASKFSPEGSVVSVTVELRGDSGLVSVSDEGIGLSIDDIGRLFKPFPGIDRPYLTERSLGLGLSICKGIVGLHGGSIWAESEGHGKGSTFTFTIPIK